MNIYHIKNIDIGCGLGKYGNEHDHGLSDIDLATNMQNILSEEYKRKDLLAFLTYTGLSNV